MLTDWIAALDGQSMRKRSFAQWNSVCVGCHRFSGLPEYVEAPEIGYHYISVTMGGPLTVEGILTGGRMAGTVRPGQAIIMAAHQSNVWKWNAATEEAHVFLDPCLVQRVADEVGFGRPELLNHCAVDDDLVRSIVMEMADELDHEDQSSRIMIETGSHYLAHHLLRRYCAKPTGARRTYGLASSKIRMLEAFAAERLNTAIGLADLAAVAGLSSYHFARSFKSATGETPHAWLTRKRMERARDLLKTTSASMLDIAGQVGFESQSHFGYVFRKWSGMTPSGFRQTSMHQGG
ncbi:MAG: helix-turn-helix transcriptional regulator [Alphaproteobacteria bacterium]|nr:helix-turn-helix transcriptional regulator [Alphaproteobacteria bacterium]